MGFGRGFRSASLRSAVDGNPHSGAWGGCPQPGSGHPLPAPLDRPWTKRFWTREKAMTMGRLARMEAAMMLSQWIGEVGWATIADRPMARVWVWLVVSTE